MSVQTGGSGAGSSAGSRRQGRTQSAATTRSRTAAPARGARWLLLLLVAFGSVHVLFMLGVEGLRLARAEISINRLEREVAGLEAEARSLEVVIEHGDDHSYREHLARRQGYMYPDETRIVTSEPR